MLAFRVAQTLQTSTSDGVAHSQGVEVHVAVALAPRARSDLPGLSQGVAVITVFAHLTAHPCTPHSWGGGRGESIRQELDGWLSCGAAGGRHQRLQSQNEIRHSGWMHLNHSGGGRARCFLSTITPCCLVLSWKNLPALDS